MSRHAAERRWGGWAVAGMLALVGGASSVPAAEFLRPANPDTPPAMSSSQRVVFRGFDSADTAMLGRLVEDTIRGVEGFLGVTVPFKPLEMIRISANAGEPGEAGRILKSQGVVNGLLQQKLVLVNPERAPREDFREALVEFLITRCLRAVQDELGGGGEAVRAPTWLALGVAGNLDGPSRTARGQALESDGGTGGILRLSGILAPPPADPSAGEIQALRISAAWFVAWLDELLGNEDGWKPVLQRLAAGNRVSAAWLTETVLQEASLRAAEKRWDLWLADQPGLQRAGQGLDFATVVELKRRVEVFPADYGVTPAVGLSHPAAPADLIVRRDAPWVQAAAARARWELERFAVGKPPALDGAVEAYREFFGALLSRPPASGAPRSEEDLAAAALRAQQAMTELEKTVAVRTQYANTVTAASQAAAPAGEAPPAGGSAPGGPAGADEAGLDLEAERRRFLDAVLGRHQER